MKETWYVVPAALAFGRRRNHAGGILAGESAHNPGQHPVRASERVMIHPAAGSIRPKGRALPRRIRGRPTKER